MASVMPVATLPTRMLVDSGASGGGVGSVLLDRVVRAWAVNEILSPEDVEWMEAEEPSRDGP